MKIAISALAVLIASAAEGAPPAASPQQDPAHVQACGQLKDLNAKEKSDMDGLGAQIKTLRQQIDGQIKPLEEQRKTLADQYKTQRDTILNQLDPTAAEARAAFENKKKELGDLEQAEIKAIREKFDAQRKDLKPPKANLNCR